MRGLSEIVADNFVIEARLEAKRKASLKRLKSRLARYLRVGNDKWLRSSIYAAIAAWDAAERKRGAR